MTTVRFEGGSEHGRVCEMTLAPTCIVPRLPRPTATVADFNLINLDEVWNGRPPPKYIRQYYRLEHRGDEWVYVYEREEQPV